MEDTFKELLPSVQNKILNHLEFSKLPRGNSGNIMEFENEILDISSEAHNQNVSRCVYETVDPWIKKN